VQACCDRPRGLVRSAVWYGPLFGCLLPRMQMEIDEIVEAAGDCLADSRRLQQVVLNLLTNAIKFTPHGGVVVVGLTLEGTAAAVAGGEAATPSARSPTLPLLLTVRDTGIGIQATDIELVFLKYTKATHAQREHGVDRLAGAGLGLSICKAIVEQHHGTIGVESVPGEGSTFSVRLELPLAPQRFQASGAVDGPDDGAGGLAEYLAGASHGELLSGCRVLVADDVDMNRSLLCSMLVKIGCVPIEANDGAAALEIVTQHREAGTALDAVLMDVQMPVMSGLEAAAAIRNAERASQASQVARSGGGTPDDGHGGVAGSGREHHRSGCFMPIIAVTGFAGPEERKRCLSVMDDYMTKPVSLGELASMLGSHLRRRNATRVAERNATRVAERNATRVVSTQRGHLSQSAVPAQTGSRSGAGVEADREGEAQTATGENRASSAAAAAAPSSAAPASPTTARLPAKLRVLVADDDATNCLVMKKTLSRIAKASAASWKLETTNIAEHAVASFEAALGTERPFDLVIVDEQFDARSAMSGSEAVRRMRGLQAGWRTVVADGDPPATAGDGAASKDCVAHGGSAGRAAFILWTGHHTDDDVGGSSVTRVADGPDDVWGKPPPSWLTGAMQSRLQRILVASG